jgi:hypothetical protein
MENFSGQQHEQDSSEKHPRTVERLSNWVTGMELGQRRSPEIGVENQDENRAEVEFEKTKEAPDISRVIKKGSMIAVGEVLADKSSDELGLIGATGVKAAKRQKLSRQEMMASRAMPTTQSSASRGLTQRQAIQLGVLVGTCVAGLILVWLSVR